MRRADGNHSDLQQDQGSDAEAADGRVPVALLQQARQLLDSYTEICRLALCECGAGAAPTSGSRSRFPLALNDDTTPEKVAQDELGSDAELGSS